MTAVICVFAGLSVALATAIICTACLVADGRWPWEDS